LTSLVQKKRTNYLFKEEKEQALGYKDIANVQHSLLVLTALFAQNKALFA
jgi:hypothetical protein